MLNTPKFHRIAGIWILIQYYVLSRRIVSKCLPVPFVFVVQGIHSYSNMLTHKTVQSLATVQGRMGFSASPTLYRDCCAMIWPIFPGTQHAGGRLYPVYSSLFEHLPRTFGLLGISNMSSPLLAWLAATQSRSPY